MTLYDVIGERNLLQMKSYNIYFGNGTIAPEEMIIQVEDSDNEQVAIDKLIDKLENDGCEYCFIDWSQTQEEGGDCPESEYVIGGNHGRLLYHGGMFLIKEIEEEKQCYCCTHKGQKMEP